MVVLGFAAALLMAEGKDVFSKYNLDEALSAAETQSKSVMVKSHADSCHFCQKMDRVTFTDKNVQKALNDYIPVKVDVDTKEGLNFARQYGITELPTIIMFDKNEKKRYRQSGFHSAKQMEQILKNELD